jgi:GMP synthase-like glutamine amidotransferase
VELQAMNILVIQNCPVTPIGLVGETLTERGARLTTLFPHRGEALPVTTRGYDGLVILGGPQHAADDAGWPAYAEMLPLIRQFHDEGRPILGICLGAQLISRAFGGTVWPFGGLEIGYLPVAITEAGRRDPLLAGLAPEQRIMQLHEDSFDLPAGAELLMANVTCANQAMRLGVTTYGFQFHLEVTRGDAPNFPRDCWGSLVRHYGAAAEAEAARVMREVEAHFDAGAAFCRTVTTRWAGLVAARRGWEAEEPARQSA